MGRSEAGVVPREPIEREDQRLGVERARLRQEEQTHVRRRGAVLADGVGRWLVVREVVRDVERE